MRVICAWCEREGEETLFGEIGLYDQPLTSHGICDDHQKVILNQIRELRIKQNPRSPRRKQSCAKLGPSGELPPPRTTGIRTSTRSRLLIKDRQSSAQLCLPFSDFYVH